MKKRFLSSVYWLFMVLFTLVFAFSIYMHLFKHDAVVGFYTTLGFPGWLVYISGVAKVLALLAIWTGLSPFLREWAYAGLFFDAAMALAAHTLAEDGGGLFSILALIGLVGSRILFDVVWGSPFKAKNSIA